MFKGLSALSNLGSIMQQAKEVGAKMQAAQQRLQQEHVTGQDPQGLAQVVMTGAGQTISVQLDPALVAAGDLVKIQSLLVIAINAAQDRTRALQTEAMAGAAEGLPLPGIADMLGKLGVGPG